MLRGDQADRKRRLGAVMQSEGLGVIRQAKGLGRIRQFNIYFNDFREEGREKHQ